MTVITNKATEAEKNAMLARLQELTSKVEATEEKPCKVRTMSAYAWSKYARHELGMW